MFFFAFLGYALLPAISNNIFPESGLLTFQTLPFPDNEELKVVTYNIGYASGLKNNKEPVTREEVETNLRSMVYALLPLNADVICLQEVDFRAARTYTIDQLEYLSKELHLPYSAYVVLWNKRYVPWPYWPPSRHFGRIVSGQAILSRYPIQKQELLRFKKPKENHFWYNWFYLNKTAQEVHLAIQGKEMIIWNIHLEAFQEETRAEQMKILAESIQKKAPELVVVAGDFNSPSQLNENAFSSRELLALKKSRQFLGSFSQTTRLQNAEGPTPFYSSSSNQPRKKIDHIFFNDRLLLKDSGNLHLMASDHLPVFAIFQEK